MKRIWLFGGLLAAGALLGALVIATAVLGHTRAKVVNDRRSDVSPGCDIREATSKVTRGGRLRHTITTRGPRQSDEFTVVLLSASRSGSIDYLLSSDGGDPASYQLTNQGKTAVFTVDRGRVREAVDNPIRYFWRAVTCSFPGDEAPNGGTVRQSLRRHDHH